VWLVGRRPPRDDRSHAGDLHARGSVVIPQAELSSRLSRSSDPGGQGVTSTDSRVRHRQATESQLTVAAISNIVKSHTTFLGQEDPTD